MMNPALSRHMAMVASCLLFALTSGAYSQTSGPNSSKLTMQGQAEKSARPIIRDVFGRPCLDVEAAARAHAVDPETKDHVVSLKNNCPRIIRAKVCYSDSDRCNDVVIQNYQRVDTILGTMRHVNFFRYSIIQK